MALLGAQAHHEVLGLDLPEHDLTDRDHVLGRDHRVAARRGHPRRGVHRGRRLRGRRSRLAYRVNCAATRFVADGARRVGRPRGVRVAPTTCSTAPRTRPTWSGTAPTRSRSTAAPSWAASWRSTPAGPSPARPGCAGYHGNNMVKTLLRLAGGATATVQLRRRPDRPSDLRRRPGRHGGQAGRGAGAGRVPHHQPGRGQLVRVRPGGVRRRRPRPRPGAARSAPPSSTRPGPAPRPANSVLDNMAWRLHGFRRSRDFREPLAELVERLLAA